MKSYKFILPSIVVALIAVSSVRPVWGAVFYSEIPYFQTNDSPFFARIMAGEAYLEDFEDQELNTPNVVSRDFPIAGSSQVGATARSMGSNFPFSVDGDDGLNGDFLGFGGDSWGTNDVFSGGSLGRMDFIWEPDALGRFPTYVGFVLTQPLDVFDEFEFVVLAASDNRAEALEFPVDPVDWIPDDSFPGDTRTHRFFGVEVEDGITRLIIANARQIDHLQYGYAPIPEPGAGVLLVLAAGACAARRRRS